MTDPRKLAEEARNELQRDRIDLIPIGVMVDALIAQADLLEKYRKGHWNRDCLCYCDLCRAYDKLMEGE